MTKKTIVFLVGVVVFAFVGIAVYAAADTGQALTNDTSIANAEVGNTEVCCQDCCKGCCEGCCEECEDCGPGAGVGCGPDGCGAAAKTIEPSI